MNYQTWQTFVDFELVPTEHMVRSHGADFFKRGPGYHSADIVFSSLKTLISERVNTKDSVGILAGGGVDSTLLIVCCGLLGIADVHCISYETSSNRDACFYIDRLCRRFGYQHLRITNDPALVECEYNRFVREHRRIPRDVIAPVHNMLCAKLVEMGCSVIIDGQFADSVLNMNPQIKVLSQLAFLFKAPYVLKPLRFLLNFLVEINKIFQVGFISQYRKRILYFEAESLVDFMLMLAKIELTPRSRRVMINLIGERGETASFLQVFNNSLLTYREEDKYLSYDVFSPFRSFSYSEDTDITKADLIGLISLSGVGGYEAHSASFKPDS